MPEFLLEIGCEEIPAGWLPGLTGELAKRFAELMVSASLEPTNVESHATPRRLVLRADVVARQADREQQDWGPAESAAKDATGNWTTSANGFAKKFGMPLNELKFAVRPGKPGTYLVHVKRNQGRPTAEVLPGVIAATLRSLPFPKRMSWDAWLDDGKGAFPFGRPIRWMVALLDGAVVPFRIYALVGRAKGDPILESGALSLGHRYFPRGAGGKPVAVKSFADLRDKLRASFVLLAREDRAEAIRKGLQAVEREIVDDHGLRHEWESLVEHPAVVVGEIPGEFRSLPREVLETVLVHHQKYVPLLPDGRSVTRFAAVTDTDGRSAPVIARGMERVVVARLRDAAFFFKEDLKRPLADRVTDLAGVTFHQKLGTYKDKADRLVNLVDAMATQMGLLTKSAHEEAREAAGLAKADLTTSMVREFTELQGVMGAIYLRAQGHARANVVTAVQWHYHPLSIEKEAAPAGRLDGDARTVFAAVSLADKLDTLAGYFGLSLQPTGSSDPFGLRRAAQGAVRVLMDFWGAAAEEARPNLRRLVAAAIAGYANVLTRPAAEVARELDTFLLDRIRYLLVARGFPGDEVEAALGAREPDGVDDPYEALVRVEALHRIRSEAREDFEHLAVAFKRAKNILSDQATTPVDPGALGQGAERDLFEVVRRLQGQDGGHEARLRALATLRAPVDKFFEDVLVMAEDPKLRANRLGLLSSALQLFYRIADISKLGG